MLDLDYLVTVATVGHVDAGKTTLVNRMLRLSKESAGQRKGTIAKRNRRSDIAPNLSPTERRRGMSIVSTPAIGTLLDERGHEYKFQFIDAPGHTQFRWQINAALSGADIALLVVDVNEGMTYDDLTLFKEIEARELPVVVALNKADRVDRARYEMSVLRMHGTLEENGFQMDVQQDPLFAQTGVHRIQDRWFGTSGRTERGDALPYLPRNSITYSGIPAVITSGTESLGIGNLLAHLFNAAPVYAPCDGGTALRLLNAVPATGSLGSTMAAKVLSGTVYAKDRVSGPAGESQLTRIYDANGRGINAAGPGTIVRLPKAPGWASGDTLSNNGGVIAPRLHTAPVLEIEISCPTAPIRLGERVREAVRDDPSYSLRLSTGSVFVGSAQGRLHLEVLVDRLREEARLNVQAKQIRPAYVWVPKERLDINGEIVLRSIPNTQSGELGEITNHVAYSGDGQGVGTHFQRAIDGARYAGIPFAGFVIGIDAAPRRTKRRGRAIQDAVRQLTARENIALFEPYVKITVDAKNAKQRNSVLGFVDSLSTKEARARHQGAGSVTIHMPVRDYITYEHALFKELKDLRWEICAAGYARAPEHVVDSLLRGQQEKDPQYAKHNGRPPERARMPHHEYRVAPRVTRNPKASEEPPKLYVHAQRPTLENVIAVRRRLVFPGF